MGSYKVVLTRTFEKDLRRLPAWLREKALEYAHRLRDDPFPRQSEKVTLSEDLYKIRIGDYRLVYRADDMLKLITRRLIDRRDVIYKRTRRR